MSHYSPNDVKFEKINNSIMTQKHKAEWTLREVSGWTKKGTTVSIPALQRGLVWKPEQVELLWDSILRGFPIGSLTLSSDKNNSSYHLLDGQQRWNAISLGYGYDDTSSARSILWFDLKPEMVWDFNKTTRKFMIRATTKAHPWGYAADDGCSRLNTAQRRNALQDKFGIDGDIMRKKGISLSDTYPVNSGYPLPLHWLLEAGEKSEGSCTIFVDYIRKKIQENEKCRTYKLIQGDMLSDEDIAKYREVFEAVVQYSVHTIYLKQSMLDKECGTSKTIEEKTITDMEILFERIGTGGTPIRESELIYSAIKAYWPEYIKTENDRLADLYMPPHQLISLGFRLALSPDTKGLFASALSVNKVRSIAKDKSSDAYKSILDLYCYEEGSRSKIDRILDKVDSWLTNDRSIPTVLRTSIAWNSPDVYLLMMSMAKRSVDDERFIITEEEITLIRATAFYLHWMVDKSERGRTASYLYKILNVTPTKEWSEDIKAVMMRLYLKEKAIPLLSTDSFCNLFGNPISSDHKWRTGGDDRVRKPWWSLWEKVSQEREVLLYAQRDYMCQEFPNYDPAKLDMWEEYNRPWDYDHMIPKNWIYQYRAKKKAYTDYCLDWKDNNGNMAAIPYEDNRSMQDNPEWDIYIKNRSALLVDDEIDNYIDLFHDDMTANQEESQRFAQKTFNRMCRIYAEVYDLLSPVDINEGVLLDSVDSTIRLRKKLLTDVADKLGGKVYFVNKDKEYPLEHNDEWAKSWLSAGIISQNGYFAAITIGIDNECQIIDDTIEIGLRRAPGSYGLTSEVTPELLEKYTSHSESIRFEMAEGSWWHFIDYIPINTSDDKIVDYLKSLVEFAESELPKA